MQKIVVLGGLLLWSSVAYGAGMTIEAYHYLTTKSNVKMMEVIKKAGKPDLVREDALGKRVRLYYLGEDPYTNRKDTTVFIDGRSDRVISIERIR